MFFSLAHAYQMVRLRASRASARSQALPAAGAGHLLAAALEWELFHGYKAIIPLTQPYHSNTTPK
jgi:hypothetical protein